MIPKRIVAIGTSAFFGDGDPVHEGFIGRLKTWHEGNDNDNYVFNLGISLDREGELTAQLLQRIIPEAQVRQPDLLLLTSGINDIRRSGGKDNPPATSPEQFTRNIHKMIEEGKAVARDVIFISVFPIKEKHDRAGNYLLPEDLERYAEITRKVCEIEKIPYVDIFNAWLKKDKEQLLSPDGVHASVLGYAAIFEQLKTFLLSYYR